MGRLTGTETRSVVARGWAGRRWEIRGRGSNGYKVSFWDDENVLELHRLIVVHLYEYTKKPIDFYTLNSSLFFK